MGAALMTSSKSGNSFEDVFFWSCLLSRCELGVVAAVNKTD